MDHQTKDHQNTESDEQDGQVDNAVPVAIILCDCVVVVRLCRVAVRAEVIREKFVEGSGFVLFYVLLCSSIIQDFVVADFVAAVGDWRVLAKHESLEAPSYG